MNRTDLIQHRKAHDLPEGWGEMQLGEHIYIAGRLGWRGLKAEEYVQSGPILLSVPNLNYGDEVDFTKMNHVSQERYDESPEIQLKVGDTLLVKDGAGIGKIGFVATLPGPATVNSSLLVVRPNNSLLTGKYAFYYLKGPNFQQVALGRITGSATPHLFQKDIKKLRVLVPPLNEQQRIVAKLEELLAKVDACQNRVAKIPVILKRFRQSVLSAACSGRLTTDWRDVNSHCESAFQILSEINEKHQTNVEALDQKDCPDDEIPSTWIWVRFGDLISELRNGVSIRPNIAPPGTPILRISAARPGRVDLNDIRYLPRGEQFFPQYKLADRDLLFTRYNGSLELLGVCGMVRDLGSKKRLYPDKLMRVRFEHAFVLPEYTEIFFQAASAHERVIAKAKSSAGQNGVSGADIKSQPFVLPPLVEQEEIVRRVTALFKFTDLLEARYRSAQAQVDRLTQSILAKAFRGELVPTEAELARREGRDFEPASALLERIREEHGESTVSSPAAARRSSLTKARRLKKA